MIYKARTVIGGNEYWDTDKKQIYFVPNGKKPGFNVDEEPEHYADAFKKIEKSKQQKSVETPELGKMTIAQLNAVAKEQSIDIPAEITKRADIIKYLGDQIG